MRGPISAGLLEIESWVQEFVGGNGGYCCLSVSGKVSKVVEKGSWVSFVCKLA